MKQLLVFFLFILSLFYGCSQKPQKEITIATNAWIGYAPLFYAQERGYLKEIDIRLISTVSLGEASDVFSVRKADMVTTTQHEYYALQKLFKELKPIILLDRSNGGDMILSNKTLPEIQSASKIYAYLEIDSINSEMIQDFTSYYDINTSTITYINSDQAQILGIEYDLNKTIVIVTYAPYDSQLKKRGFQTIASTKDKESIIVIDAICATQSFVQKHTKRIKKLKQIIDRSIEEIQENPKSSYKLVSKYLNNITYSEYLKSLNMIEWINKPSDAILNDIKHLGYKEEFFI